MNKTLILAFTIAFVSFGCTNEETDVSNAAEESVITSEMIVNSADEVVDSSEAVDAAIASSTEIVDEVVTSSEEVEADVSSTIDKALSAGESVVSTVQSKEIDELNE